MWQSTFIRSSYLYIYNYFISSKNKVLRYLEYLKYSFYHPTKKNRMFSEKNKYHASWIKLLQDYSHSCAPAINPSLFDLQNVVFYWRFPSIHIFFAETILKSIRKLKNKISKHQLHDDICRDEWNFFKNILGEFIYRAGHRLIFQSFFSVDWIKHYCDFARDKTSRCLSISFPIELTESNGIDTNSQLT